MKKNFLIALLVAVVFSGSAFANTGKSVNALVKQSFQREFSGAQSVSWEVISNKDIFHASFIMNNERLNAYFDAEGTLLATGRYVKQENLPMLVTKGVTVRYKQYVVVEAIEFVTGSETSYIIKLENEKHGIHIQAYNDGNTTLLKKEKKK
ncbi:MAG TPA: hypothetical protein VIY47_09245 [Ignavibacteriaceae bacterium]